MVSNPWNLEAGSLALQRTWLGREIYSKTMSGNLKRLVARHKEQLVKNPKLDFETLEKITYLHEFDRIIQCSTWGYPTERAYYRDASSSDSLLAVRIPLFAINATDDPVSKICCLLNKQPCILTCSDRCQRGNSIPGVQAKSSYCFVHNIARRPSFMVRVPWGTSMAC